MEKIDVSKKDKGLFSIRGYTRKDISKWVDKVGTIGGLIILLIFFSFTADYFFTVRNWFNISNQTAIYGLMAIAMTFPLYQAVLIYPQVQLWVFLVLYV